MSTPKPTHILVSIEEVSKFYSKLPFLFDTFPKVDLSEEGIEELALNVIYDMFSTNIRMNGIRPELRDLCVRFAKDLLNTK